jgi:Flp pilus assembly protein TadD
MGLRRSALTIWILALLVTLVAQDRIATAAVLQDEICDVTADYHLGAGNYLRAAELHQKLLAAHPNDALAHYHLGFAYGMLGMRDKEVAEYRQAVGLGLKQWDLFLNLGRVYLEDGKAEAAADAFRYAVSFGPDRPESHYNLGLAYERRGMFTQARNELMESLLLDPKQPDARNMMAVIDVEVGDDASARKVWAELARTDPGFAPARTNLAILDRADNARSNVSSQR